jgi:hypothetical protein
VQVLDIDRVEVGVFLDQIAQRGHPHSLPRRPAHGCLQ